MVRHSEIAVGKVASPTSPDDANLGAHDHSLQPVALRLSGGNHDGNLFPASAALEHWTENCEAVFGPIGPMLKQRYRAALARPV